MEKLSGQVTEGRGRPFSQSFACVDMCVCSLELPGGRSNTKLCADELATASQVQLVLLLDGGGRVTAWPKLDGSFVFYDVPAGPHMLETISTNLVYPQVR